MAELGLEQPRPLSSALHCDLCKNVGVGCRVLFVALE